MVRHSGFLTSMAAVLLAAFSVSILEQRSDGSSQIRAGADRGEVLTGLESGRFLGYSCPKVDGLTPVMTSHAGETVRFTVPENSLVIVGSLDVSGAAHSVLVSSQPNEQQRVDESSLSQDFVDLKYIDTASLPDLHGKLQGPGLCTPEHSAAKISESSALSSTAISIADKPSRRFLVPHFENDQVVQQPCEAVPLAEGSRVKVYLDRSVIQSDFDSSQHQQICEDAERVCTSIECDLLPHIERWIGRISDLDGDQRLSVILTDLDRRKSHGETPILGCVRRSDFSADDQNSLAGDIVYLDRHLPPREQLRALLAHELTHAAIFCIRHEAPKGSSLGNHSVPSWLNEAAAHWVERQFCSTPAGFAAREATFRQSPALCPIILNDDDYTLQARRTGSRVAGFTFLHQHLEDASELRELLQQSTPFEQSIVAIAGAPFSQLFREWTISQIWADQASFSRLHSRVSFCSVKTANDEPMARKLHGTAFLILQSEVDQQLCISAHRDAQLQITVLHQKSSLNTQRAPDFSRIEGVRSAEHHSMIPSNVR